MTPFTYARAGDAAEAVRLGGAGGAAYLGGGTNLVDLMRETIERPGALVDVTGLSDAIEETDDGGLLIGAAVRNTALAEHRAVRDALSGAGARDPRRRHRRRSATWRRSAATCCSGRAAPISTTPTDRAATSAQPGAGLRRDRRLQPHPRDPRRVAGLRRDASVRHVRGARRARRGRCIVEGAGGARDAAVRRPAPPARRPARDRDGAAAGRADHRGRAARRCRSRARSTYRKVRDRASYAFALVSVAAALEVEDGAIARRPARAGRRRAQAVARVEGGGGAARRPGDRARRSAPRREAELADAAPLRDNGFKIELAHAHDRRRRWANWRETRA